MKARLFLYGGLLLFPASGLFWLLSLSGGGEFGAGSGEVRDRLRTDVVQLAGKIGPRSPMRPLSLVAAEQYITKRWEDLGYDVARLPYEVFGGDVANLEVVIEGIDPTLPCIVIGAHYDTVEVSTPGADDNASGVALLLELSRALRTVKPVRTVRLVAFVLEEPPYFQTADMGSLVYARTLAAAGTSVELMISLESLGYYSTEPGSQTVPPGLGWVFTDVGDFVGVVGNLSSVNHVTRVSKILSEHEVKVVPAALPSFVPGVGWSDHWSFWQVGHAALMLTDTAPFRNAGYHQATDTPDTLDYDRMAALSAALPPLVMDLSGAAGTGLGASLVICVGMIVVAVALMLTGIWQRVRRL